MLLSEPKINGSYTIERQAKVIIHNLSVFLTSCSSQVTFIFISWPACELHIFCLENFPNSARSFEGKKLLLANILFGNSRKSRHIINVDICSLFSSYFYYMLPKRICVYVGTRYCRSCKIGPVKYVGGGGGRVGLEV